MLSVLLHFLVDLGGMIERLSVGDRVHDDDSARGNTRLLYGNRVGNLDHVGVAVLVLTEHVREHDVVAVLHTGETSLPDSRRSQNRDSAVLARTVVVPFLSVATVDIVFNLVPAEGSQVSEQEVESEIGDRSSD